ncbi:MAG TPA: hypothetical protein VJN93_13645 [Candidatus Acidoferrum sp.]|nr:hypothetical protein [Candidatus Acidoferrum sp.]
MSDALQRVAGVGVQRKDTTNNLCLCLIHFQPCAAARILHGTVSKTPPASVRAAKCEASHSAMRFLTEFAPVHCVNQPMHADQKFSLRVERIDALGYSNHANTSER